MQLCGLAWYWPVKKLWAEYLSEVWLQKVNDMCISITASALVGQYMSRKRSPGQQVMRTHQAWGHFMELITELWSPRRDLKRLLFLLCLSMLKKKKQQPKTTQSQSTFIVWLEYSCKCFLRGQWVIPDVHHFLPCIFWFKHFDYLQMKWSKIESFSIIREQYNSPIC